MNISSPLTRIVFSMAVIGGISLLLPQPSWAQTSVNPLQDLETKDGGNDPFSSRRDDSTFSVFDLIHRAQLGSNRDSNEFNAEQEQSLDQAAAEFRARQMELFQQSAPANSVSTPQVGN